jgi:VWFA-related protein
MLMMTSAAVAQAPVDATTQDAATTITSRSTIVLVPALVKTKKGDVVFTLKADDFLATDDGVPQRLRLEPDTDSQPLALVVCVQTGGAGIAHLGDYENMQTILEAFIGNIEHTVAVVGFDSHPVLLHGFTPRLDFIAKSMANLDTGDPKGAVLDALAFSVGLLRSQPPTYRRAILLLSETGDDGSQTSLESALRAIGDTNTTVYSLAFSSTKHAIGKEAAKLNSAEPGPEHGCFSRDYGKDEDGNPIPPPEGRATQNFDCAAQLLPPLRLAKMAEIAARNALRRNTPESVAELTGGEYYKFKDAKTLERDLITLSNHVPNRYVLSFRPQQPHTGFHSLTLKLKSYPDLVIEARTSYWVEQ